MAEIQIEFRGGNLRLPELGLWLDPHEPQLGSELVFVSHAHSDHTAAHREVILSEPTARLMQARLPGVREEHILEFGKDYPVRQGAQEYRIRLLPAGHIFGSAMAMIESNGERLLYTGDFKLRRGLSAEPCTPERADTLIMETTYGRPHYVFPPTEAVLAGITRFCREAIDNEEIPLLLGYSLGKSQEILRGLADAGIPLMLHESVWKLTRIYEQLGQSFPAYERYESGKAHGKVLLFPPNAASSRLLHSLGKVRSAVLTGWAVDPHARFRYQSEAAFPLSDHADFPDLMEMVKQVQPKRIYTLHGFAADFAQTLRDRGYDARALSEDEQFSLQLGEVESRSKPKAKLAGLSQAIKKEPPASFVDRGASPTFASFAATCAEIGRTSSKLEKIRLVAEYLRPLDGANATLAASWFSGRPFPVSQNRVLQLGWAVLRDALCAAAGITEAAFHHVYLKHSDLGETAAELIEGKVDRSSLTLFDVESVYKRLHEARGPLAKTPILTGVLQNCTGAEAKFLVKIITGDLRIGLKQGLVEEAVGQAFDQPSEAVRQANLLLGDIADTAQYAAEKRLSEASLIPFRPVKLMLASSEPTAEDVWERMLAEVNAEATSETIPETKNSAPHLVWVEDKYDGIRCQLHWAGGRVALYSRDLKEITETFQELAEAVGGISEEVILDGEIIAMRGEEVLPFADLQRRLGRKQRDLFMREEIPIQFVVFDLLWKSGQTFLNKPLRERRAALESLQLPSGSVRLARITQAASAKEIDEAFAAARNRGNEGLMIKEPSSAYTQGCRGLAWIKLKKAFATLDCVVVGAEYGHGKRRQVLSDYTFAVRDESSGELKTIGKAYSGLTDVEIAQLTKHFLSRAIRQTGRYFEVPPDTVLEIAFDRIQLSQRHNSGLALRFPRIVRIRTDKTPAEIDTLSTARKLVAK